MIVGIGTDIFSVSRLKVISGEPQDPFFRRAFTESEQKQAALRPDPLWYYATRFAGKEAVYKAVSVCGCGFIPHDIEILDLESGQPVAAIHGETAKSLKNFIHGNVTLYISLSYDLDYASAFALAENKTEGI